MTGRKRSGVNQKVPMTDREHRHTPSLSLDSGVVSVWSYRHGCISFLSPVISTETRRRPMPRYIRMSESPIHVGTRTLLGQGPGIQTEGNPEFAPEKGGHMSATYLCDPEL